MGGASYKRVWQAVAAGGLGVAATVVGVAVFLPRVVLGELDAVNLAGALLAIAGVVVLGLLVRVAFRGRRPLVKALAIPLVFALVQWVLIPAVGAGRVEVAIRSRSFELAGGLVLATEALQAQGEG